MKLYSAKGANSPRKVLIFIAEKNISDIEVVNLDLMHQVQVNHLNVRDILFGNKDQDFTRAVRPLGTVKFHLFFSPS